MRRSDQRRDAVFALYQRDVTGRSLDELLDEAKPFTRELALGTDAQLAELDEEISRLSRGWELDRIAALERSIMRVALHEMRDGRAGRGGDRRGGQPGAGVLRRRRARVRQRDPRLGCTRERRGGLVSDPAARVRELAAKLGELSEQLGDPEVSDERAAELAREAAELVSEAGNEIDRALREAEGDDG